MAKGYPMGLWKGKKGSSVFYKIWNTNNKVSQGIREYQPVVRNPQTNTQTIQRMKMQPAQNIAIALRDIISRSFQGVQYGSPSRLEFRKLAMRSSTGWPYLLKGSTQPVPGSYQISRGGLPVISCSQNDTKFVSNINATSSLGELTLAQFSNSLVEDNVSLDIKDGDQITFVWCTLTNGNFIWHYGSVALNTSSTDDTTMDDVFQSLGLEDWDIQNGKIACLNLTACAAAIIHSRLGSDGLFQRSDSVISVGSQLEDWFTPEQRLAAMASYQAATNTSKDWPVEKTRQTEGPAYYYSQRYTIESVTSSQYNALIGQEVMVGVNVDTGVMEVVYTTDYLDEPGFLTKPNGQALTYQVQSDVLGATPAMVPALAYLTPRVWPQH